MKIRLKSRLRALERTDFLAFKITWYFLITRYLSTLVFGLVFIILLGNLRTTTKFTTTTSVDRERTGRRKSVSAGKRKLKMQSIGRSTTTTLNRSSRTVMFVRNKVFSQRRLLKRCKILFCKPYVYFYWRWRIFSNVWPFRMEKSLLSVRRLFNFQPEWDNRVRVCLSEVSFGKRDIPMR